MKKVNSIWSETIFIVLLAIMVFLFFFSFIVQDKEGNALRFGIAGVMLVALVAMIALGMKKKRK